MVGQEKGMKMARTMQKIFLFLMKEKHGKRTRKKEVDKRYQTLKLIIFQNVHLCWAVNLLENGNGKRTETERERGRSESGIKVR